MTGIYMSGEAGVIPKVTTRSCELSYPVDSQQQTEPTLPIGYSFEMGLRLGWRMRYPRFRQECVREIISFHPFVE